MDFFWRKQRKNRASCTISPGAAEEVYVLDPFLGSGTTLIACALLNRKGIGVDNEKGDDISEKAIQR